MDATAPTPDDARERDRDEGRAECPVCLEPLAARIATRPPCGHEVCLECLLRLAAPRRCPMCRASLHVSLPPPRTLTRSGAVVTLRRPPLLVEEDGEEEGDGGGGGARALRTLLDRVRHMEVLDDALANGAAPRNAVYATRLLPPTRESAAVTNVATRESAAVTNVATRLLPGSRTAAPRRLAVAPPPLLTPPRPALPAGLAAAIAEAAAVATPAEATAAAAAPPAA